MPEAQEEATQILNEYLRSLKEAGITAERFADYMRNWLGWDDVGGGDPGDDNIPGYQYADRMSTAMSRALRAQAEEFNGAWRQIRQGRYGFGAAMRSWAKLAEGYYDVYLEALRGPSEVPRPSWLVITYNVRNRPANTFPVRCDGLDLGDKPELECTNFAGARRPDPNNLETVPVAAPKEYIYEGSPQVDGKRILVTFNDQIPDRVGRRELQLGDYVGFIFRKQAGRSMPLVIVTLRLINE
jgi:hypothetical protein